MSAPVTSTAPGASAPARRPSPVSGSSSRVARTQAAAPIGTLTKKIQCQVSRSVSTPPASRPIDAPALATKEKTPIAFACSPGSGNIVTIIPRITAEASAPPTPWTKRAAISISGLDGQAAQQRGEGEDGEAGEKDRAPADQVTEPARRAAAARRTRSGTR